MVIEAEMKKHTMEVQEVHNEKILVPMRSLGGSSNLVCKNFHMVQLLEAPCPKAYSSMEGFYSPSWTYVHLNFSPRAADFTVLPLDIPLASN